jgi:ATP-binding cassette subfamily C (CFTR/MRP) protein 1
MSGLTTIRAFAWEGHEKDRNRKLLNASQRPKYLLAMIQIWLQTNLTLLVGVIAVILTALATQLKVNTGFTGASLLTLMNLTGSINSLMRNYAELETSIGAVNRLRMFTKKVKPEDELDEDAPVPEEWPTQGKLHLGCASATYRYGSSFMKSNSFHSSALLVPGKKRNPRWKNQPPLL